MGDPIDTITAFLTSAYGLTVAIPVVLIGALFGRKSRRNDKKDEDKRK